ncbi:MAG: DUF2608 domain-containing protein [Rickettsiaceae bacterium]
MIIIRYIVVCLGLILLPYCSSAALYSATTIEEINNSILNMLEKRNAAKTLVIMPFKNFFATPIDPEFHITNKNFAPIINRITKKAKESRASYIDEIILTKYKNQFIDPMLPKFIDNLQQKNVPLIVVTYNVSGNIDDIEHLEVWTWQYLFNKGIDLSKSPIGEHQILFNARYKKVKGSYPTFYKGLLSCSYQEGENSPQAILASLLMNELKWLPDVVYVVDYEEGYIKSLQQQFHSLDPNIQVEGFVYKPKPQKFKEVTSKEFESFWQNVIKQLNSLTRKELNKSTNDPYEN